MNNNNSKIIGFFCVVIAVGIVGFVLYFNNSHRQIPIVFSPKTMLDNVWQKYKAEYLEKGTLRTLDKQQNNITTSEGEGYTLLRAVWLDDQSTFDVSWKWVKDNIQRKDDHLISWLFGKRPNGSYAVITERGGQNTASDADVDIALALLFAGQRWNNPQYTGDALAMLNDIWKNEVVVIGGKPYLVANNLEKNSPIRVLINPSYFAPYAYRIFSQADKAHDWKSLVATSYDVLEKSSRENLNTSTGSVGLPPDWLTMERATGVITAVLPKTLTTNYSFDALRIPWRISLDYIWNKEPRAKTLLEQMHFLGDAFAKNNAIYSSYAHDGTPVLKSETPAMYGGAIGYFVVTQSKFADAVYRSKLLSLYNPDREGWKSTLSYYDDNWAWFGIAMYNNELPNLFLTPQQ